MFEECMCCGGDTFEADGKHFCHTINCPLCMKPQEWFEKHECNSCGKADSCKGNDGTYCIQPVKKENESK